VVDALLSMMLAIVLLVGMVTLTGNSLRSEDTLARSWLDLEQSTRERDQTRISNMEESSCDGSNVYIVLVNDGSVAVVDFDDWDVIVQYYSAGSSYQVKWLSYDGSPPQADNTWAVEGIYRDASGSLAEIYEEGIFNVGEELKLQIKVSPAVDNGSRGVVTVSTPNGVGAWVQFSR